MKWSFVVALIGFSVLFSCGEKIDNSKAEEYIRESEKLWAESVASGDTNVIRRILADDFIGVSTEGDHYDKATEIRETATAPQHYISNHLNDVKIRLYGNFAIAQGNETWVKKDSSTGRFIWTDTWIFRDGKWQILAAEDVLAPVQRK